MIENKKKDMQKKTVIDIDLEGRYSDQKHRGILSRIINGHLVKPRPLQHVDPQRYVLMVYACVIM